MSSKDIISRSYKDARVISKEKACKMWWLTHTEGNKYLYLKICSLPCVPLPGMAQCPGWDPAAPSAAWVPLLLLYHRAVWSLYSRVRDSGVRNSLRTKPSSFGRQRLADVLLVAFPVSTRSWWASCLGTPVSPADGSAREKLVLTKQIRALFIPVQKTKDTVFTAINTYSTFCSHNTGLMEWCVNSE